jgi:NADH dehydrogenase
MAERLLVTGATGFIGRAVCAELERREYDLRLLLRPSRSIRGIPPGNHEVAVASLSDPRSLRAALVGVQTIVHLASAEGERRRRDLLATDVEGTALLAEQARLAGVQRILYLSHIGASRISAFPFLQAKGIAEQILLESGLNTCIVRTSSVFGPEDSFTNVIALAASVMPIAFYVPQGQPLLQPLWIGDLVAAVAIALQEGIGFGEVLSVGGPEHLTIDDVVQTVLAAARHPRLLARVWPPYLRLGATVLDALLPFSPLTPFWVDYLAVNRTCEANAMARHFGVRPARLAERLDYLRRGRGVIALLRFILRGPLTLAASRSVAGRSS